MSIPCDNNHLTSFIPSVLYIAIDDMGKGMIRWYIITRIHKTLPCIHINRCWIVCGENSNATFTLHHYRQYQQLQQQNQVGWCFFATSRHIHSHKAKAFYNSMSYQPTFVHALYVYLSIQMYVYTKQISPPLSFASFKFLYASMHSDVSQFCTNTTFIIVNCIPPLFHLSVQLCMYICLKCF